MTNPEKQPYGTVLLKAAKILDFLSVSDEPQSLQRIAQQTELTNSTALKILDTLLLIGYVTKDPELKKFSLGTGIIRYAIKAMDQLDIKQIAQKHLEELQESLNETVHLGILDGTSVVYVTKIESKNPVCLYSRVGKTIPLYCSAMGKAILADQSNQEINQYLSTTKLVKKTEKTITTKEAFLQEIDRIRELGYACDDSEHEDEIFCIGASITMNGNNFGALSVSIPKYRLTEEKHQKMIDEIQKCKAKILHDLI